MTFLEPTSSEEIKNHVDSNWHRADSDQSLIAGMGFYRTLLATEMMRLRLFAAIGWRPELGCSQLSFPIRFLHRDALSWDPRHPGEPQQPSAGNRAVSRGGAASLSLICLLGGNTPEPE